MYRQRAAVERINSQAFHLGIERPHLRNGSAIANLNTLIYTLINLRLFHRLHQQNTPASLSDNGTTAEPLLTGLTLYYCQNDQSPFATFTPH
jgi:hypothetical protein